MSQLVAELVDKFRRRRSIGLRKGEVEFAAHAREVMMG